jgi:hypothetical protein
MITITRIHALALTAALAATPAYACTDWQAVAAFDSDYVAASNSSFKAWWSRNIHYSGAVCESAANLINRLKRLGLIEADRQAAIADKCQENAQ